MKRYRVRPSRAASAMVVVFAAVAGVLGTVAFVKRGGGVPWFWLVAVVAIAAYHLANLCGVLPSRLLLSPKLLGQDIEEIDDADEVPPRTP